MSILGIDEVGRGPWAGPLVIGACILPKDEAGNYPDWVEPLTDSKKLSEKKREAYSKIILENALATGLGWVTSAEIDSLGLSESLRLATRRAVEEIKIQKVPFTEIIIDGTINFLAGTSLEYHVTNLKKADLLIKEVSAASIIAKVARDNYMKEISSRFPEYGFEKHVGYGTKLHSEMLAKHGPCPEHRLSFRPVATLCSATCPIPQTPAVQTTAFTKRVRGDVVDERRTECCGLDDCGARTRTRGELRGATTKEIGDYAESIVTDYLIKNNHSIIVRNHKTKFYEIDIVSTKDDKIYFTEVKYRKDQYRGTSLDMVTKKKLQQMTFAADSFLKYYKDLKNAYSPLLAVGLVSGSDFNFDDWLVIK
ncbi:ribonuclease HII [Candidatus Saccharibacteria bacterium]|nr:ribonuclease HII [Candidatus Saccharibacteria bacterium]MBR6122384.1 ribonuclease HII [Candidatus Saccharibacteria bacterium]